MPAVDYDYSYYGNARKINSINNKGVAKRVNSSVSTTSNRKTNYSTRTSTKEQVRKAMAENPKKQVNNTAKRTTKKNNNLDIPAISHGKRINENNANVKSTRNNVSAKPKNDNNLKNKPAEMKLKKPELSTAQKKKAKEKAVGRVKNALYLVIGFAIAFLICYRYSLINERFNQLEDKKEELAVAQTVNEQIQADIDSQTDLSYIENYAKYQLGMQKPSNSQIVYVNVEKEDRILTPITIEETSDKTWLDELYEGIMKLFE